MPSPQYRAWVFTLNNPDFAAADLPKHPDERYCSWQLEEVACRHIQGYVELTKPRTLVNVKRWLPAAHFEPRRGSAEQARDYSQKVESRIEGPFERGTFSPGQGSRNDLEAVKAAIIAGATRRELLDNYSEAVAKYPRFVSEYSKVVREAAVEKLPELVPRYSWQQSVLDMVNDTRNNIIRFSGDLKNKSELKRILQQTGCV